ncbi:MAG TPA: NAD-dependent epimerase/dehydratase family protein [Amnibacterium sp.]|jgi:nucleoside-diphosphate-sugar epimerase|nr:NAD-dependent epimerase/dehydratase family protein [Amnibacterium sp.]
MKLLVLGGTAWLGGAVAADAVARGADVVCLARGTAGSVPQGARLVVADRDDPAALDAVRHERWDAVVDVARQPGHVRNAVTALAPVAERFVFVSTGNVYADQRTPGQDEDSPLLAPLESDLMASMEEYGPAKVACEHAVRSVFGDDRSVIARAGLIAGPGDGSGRSGYWPWRFAHPSNADGRVLVPDALDRSAAVIDVRDLAAWLVDAAERRTAGVFDTVGQAMPLGEHLDTARAVAGGRATIVPAGEQWLAEHGVEEWAGPRSLPLWLCDPDWWGMNARTGERARAAGLTNRPLAATLADLLGWEEQREHPHGAGLTDDEERELLAALA